VGLIQAFMHEPELLILDEPIAGLDPLVQQSFHDLLREVVAQGRTVFLSSHTLSEVERVARRVAILRRGRLAVVDSLDNLHAIAVRRLDIEFAGAAPQADQLQALPGVRDWLKFASPFYYYAGHDPLGRGIDLADLAVLGAATAALTVIATLGFRHRDLRA
jgi:ABC-type multidrug transport system ATPase subunit